MPVTYAWTFGGSGTSSGIDGPTPVFTYTVPGTYTVQLDVDNACPESAVQFLDDVHMRGTEPTIYLPLLLRTWSP